MISDKLDAIGKGIILVISFLLPIFFIPSLSAPLYETKIFMLSIGVLLVAILWTTVRLKGNSITIPKEKFIIPITILPLIALLSSFFSGNLMHSLVGQGVEVDTALMTLILSFAFMAGMYLFNSRGSVVRLYLTITASALILFLYQIVKLTIGADFLDFGLFTTPTSNLLGKWNDLAIFAGFTTLLSLITMDMLRPKGLIKVFFYTALVVSLATMIIVNFSLVWVVLSIAIFILFLRSFLKKKFLAKESEENNLSHSHGNNVSGVTLFVLAVSILFIFSGASFEKFTSDQFGVVQIEARPSWQGTINLAEDVYSEDLLFGSGPNNFTKEWLKYKPEGINNTPFWNTSFSFGVGIIPTLFITHGIFSALMWLLFIVLFLFSGMRGFVNMSVNPFDNYLSTSSFFSAAFLWILSIFYIPHPTLFFFAFLFSGIFVAVRVQSGIVKEKTFVFNENPVAGFLWVALLFSVLIISLLGLYVSTQKFISIVYVQRASMEAIYSADVVKAEGYINKAIAFNKSDFVYRASAEVSMFKLNNLIRAGESTLDVQQQFQTILTQTINAGSLAISYDDRNFVNWEVLGRVYEIIIPLGVDGAYENARSSYEKAFSLNPLNPKLALNLARIEAIRGNNDVARSHIANSLSIKNDYVDAIFLLSQIEIEEGNISNAIESIEAAAFLTPQNQLVFFQLGILKYSERDYGGAVNALERAITLDSRYSNARYFLGLSYYKQERYQDAINQFSVIRDLNPESTEVRAILDNLIAGRAPFEEFTQSADTFEGFGLPIEE